MHYAPNTFEAAARLSQPSTLGFAPSSSMPDPSTEPMFFTHAQHVAAATEPASVSGQPGASLPNTANSDLKNAQPFIKQRRLPSILLDSWEFRKLATEGSVLTNAMVSHDVDDDGVEEVIVGTTEGLLCVVKPDCRAPLFLRVLAATISVVLYTPIRKRLVLITLEGQCEVIDYFLSPSKSQQQQQQHSNSGTRPPSVIPDVHSDSNNNSGTTAVHQRTDSGMSGHRQHGTASAASSASAAHASTNPHGAARSTSHTSHMMHPLLYEAAHQPSSPPTQVFHVPSNCLCADLSTDKDTDRLFLGSYDRRFYVYSIATGSCLLSLFVHDPITSVKAFTIPAAAADVHARRRVASSSIAVTGRPGNRRHRSREKAADRREEGEGEGDEVPLLMTRQNSSSFHFSAAKSDTSVNASTYTAEYQSPTSPASTQVFSSSSSPSSAGLYVPLVFLSTPTHLILLPGGLADIQQWRKLQPKTAHLPLTLQLHSDTPAPSTTVEGDDKKQQQQQSREQGTQDSLRGNGVGERVAVPPSLRSGGDTSSLTMAEAQGRTTNPPPPPAATTSTSGGRTSETVGRQGTRTSSRPPRSASVPREGEAPVPPPPPALSGPHGAVQRRGQERVAVMGVDGTGHTMSTARSNNNNTAATTNNAITATGRDAAEPAEPLSSAQQHRLARKRAIKAAEMGRPVLVKPLWAMHIGRHSLHVPALQPTPPTTAGGERSSSSNSSPLVPNSSTSKGARGTGRLESAASLSDQRILQRAQQQHHHHHRQHRQPQQQTMMAAASAVSVSSATVQLNSSSMAIDRHSRRSSQQRGMPPRRDTTSLFSISSPSSVSAVRNTSDIFLERSSSLMAHSALTTGTGAASLAGDGAGRSVRARRSSRSGHDGGEASEAGLHGSAADGSRRAEPMAPANELRVNVTDSADYVDDDVAGAARRRRRRSGRGEERSLRAVQRDVSTGGSVSGSVSSNSSIAMVRSGRNSPPGEGRGDEGTRSSRSSSRRRSSSSTDSGRGVANSSSPSGDFTGGRQRRAQGVDNTDKVRFSLPDEGQSASYMRPRHSSEGAASVDEDDRQGGSGESSSNRYSTFSSDSSSDVYDSESTYSDSDSDSEAVWGGGVRRNDHGDDSPSAQENTSSSDSDDDDDEDAARRRRRRRRRAARRSTKRSSVDPSLLARSLARMRAESVPTTLLRRLHSDTQIVHPLDLPDHAAAAAAVQHSRSGTTAAAVADNGALGAAGHTSLMDLALLDRKARRLRHARDASAQRHRRRRGAESDDEREEEEENGRGNERGAGGQLGDVRLPTSVDVSVGASQVAVALCCEDGLAIELRFTVAKLSSLSRRARHRATRPIRLYDLRHPPCPKEVLRRQQRRRGGGAAAAVGAARFLSHDDAVDGQRPQHHHQLSKKPSSSPSSPTHPRSVLQGTAHSVARQDSYALRRSAHRPTSTIYLPLPTPGPAAPQSTASPLPVSLIHAASPSPGMKNYSIARAESTGHTLHGMQTSTGAPVTVVVDDRHHHSHSSHLQQQGRKGAQRTPSPSSPLMSQSASASGGTYHGSSSGYSPAARRGNDDAAVVLRAQCLWAARLGDSPLVQRARVFCVKDTSHHHHSNGSEHDDTFCTVFVAANGTCYAVDGNTLSVVECAVKEDCSSFTLMTGPSSTMPAAFAEAAGLLSARQGSHAHGVGGTHAASNHSNHPSSTAGGAAFSSSTGNDGGEGAQSRTADTAASAAVQPNVNANLLRGAVGRTVSCVCVSVDELCIYSVGEANQLVQHRDAPYPAATAQHSASHNNVGAGNSSGIASGKALYTADTTDHISLLSRRLVSPQCATAAGKAGRGAPGGEVVSHALDPSSYWDDVLDGQAAAMAEAEEKALLRLLARRLREEEEEQEAARAAAHHRSGGAEGGTKAAAAAEGDEALLQRMKRLLMSGYSDAEWEKLKLLDETVT